MSSHGQAMGGAGAAAPAAAAYHNENELLNGNSENELNDGNETNNNNRNNTDANEEGLTLDEWTKKVTRYITNKPIFHIAVHGEYDERALTARPVAVPGGCMILEFTTLAEILSTAYGRINGILDTLLLSEPDHIASIVTAPPGTEMGPDLRLLHRSAKYIDPETYYQRAISLEESDLRNPADNTGIRKHYIVKDPINMPDQTRWLIDRTARNEPTYMNDLIEHIRATDIDTQDAGGCVCIFFTCGAAETMPTRKQYDKIIKRYEKSIFRYNTEPNFVFNRSPNLEVVDPAVAQSARVPEYREPNHYNPFITNQGYDENPDAPIKDLRIAEIGMPAIRFGKEHSLYSTAVGGVAGLDFLHAPLKIQQRYAPPAILSSIPSNIGQTSFIVNGKTYYNVERIRGRRTRRRQLVFGRNRATRILAKYKSMKTSRNARTRRKAPKSVQIFYKGQWHNVNLE
jgi:hypothetical protein